MKPKSLPWGTYLAFGTGRRLSMLGERLGIHWLTYNPIVFRMFHSAAAESAPRVMEIVAGTFPNAKRYVDVGAGTGAYAAALQRLGLAVIACENSASGRKWARKQQVDCRDFDLTRAQPAELGGSFDLAYCFEVAEHLPPALGDRLVEFLASLAPVVVFSAALPGQGGTGHINEQPKEYWILRFEKLGLKVLPAESRELSVRFQESNVSATWLSQNVIAFGK